MNTEGLCMGCMNDNGGVKNCPICGFDNNSLNPLDCLPIKSFIHNRYILGTVIKRDGEGITYIGWDNARMAKVKIKEYYPIGFCHRNPDKTVSISENGRYTYNEGLLEFIEINRIIMTSALPCLAKVYDVFEENGTAYSITEFVNGITMEDFLKKNGGILKWEQTRSLFLSLIDTIGGMNDLGIIHGGISTETIIVGRDGKLKIEGYSIKKLRRNDSELQSKIYDGYAACEQYGIENLVVDTYTDVYGLAATIFRTLIGTVPPESTQRLENDIMTIPARFAEELPRQVLAALANGLQVLPANRTVNIEAFKNELVYGEIEAVPVPKKAVVSNTAATIESNKKEGNSAKYIAISAICTIFVLALIGLLLWLFVFRGNGEENNQSSTVITSSEVESEDFEFGQTVSGMEQPEQTYTVPNLIGKYYSDVSENDDFEIVIKDEAFSDKYPKGAICAQSIDAGKELEKDADNNKIKLEVTISSGPKEISIANVCGKTEAEAKLILLNQGFLSSNIKTVSRYDSDSEPGVVLAQYPEAGTTVSPHSSVTIEINSYEGDETDNYSDYQNDYFTNDSVTGY